MSPEPWSQMRADLARLDHKAALETAAALARELERYSAETLAAMDRDGTFGQTRYRSFETFLMDLTKIEFSDARRICAAARSACPRATLQGEALPPRLPVTAELFAAGELTVRHVEVIAQVLATRAARRLTAETWTGAETQLAEHARTCMPAELRRFGQALVELLDQDGAPPDDTAPAPNELHLTPYRDGTGGAITGRLDATTFERVQTILDAKTAPAGADDPRTLGERQADAFSETCAWVLEHGTDHLPDTGGHRPQVVVTVPLADLRAHARQATLEFGARLSPVELRMLTCDCCIIRVVMNGASAPLDVGRATRGISPALRRAVIARDGGCAHPGCDRPASWVECHHIVPWEHGGETKLDNLVALCHQHHKQVHATGWDIQMTANGIPEFLPPAWMDHERTPRRKPRPPTRAAAPPRQSAGQIRAG